MTFSPNLMLTAGHSNFKRKNSRKFGDLGEKLAIKHLTAKGYDLIVQNYYVRGGEIDLIMQKNGILVFVEVKTRGGSNFGAAAEALTPAKKRKMLCAIKNYLQRLGGHANWRADLIAIDFTGARSAAVTHYENIFEK